MHTHRQTMRRKNDIVQLMVKWKKEMGADYKFKDRVAFHIFFSNFMLFLHFIPLMVCCFSFVCLLVGCSVTVWLDLFFVIVSIYIKKQTHTYIHIINVTEINRVFEIISWNLSNYECYIQINEQELYKFFMNRYHCCTLFFCLSHSLWVILIHIQRIS